MPYKVVDVPGGYKVKRDQKGRPQYFSKEALSKEAAERQLVALFAAEKKRLTSRRCWMSCRPRQDPRRLALS